MKKPAPITTLSGLEKELRRFLRGMMKEVNREAKERAETVFDKTLKQLRKRGRYSPKLKTYRPKRKRPTKFQHTPK